MFCYYLLRIRHFSKTSVVLGAFQITDLRWNERNFCITLRAQSPFYLCVFLYKTKGEVVAMKGVGRLISRALHHRQTCQFFIPSQLISRRLIFSSSRTSSLLAVGNSSSGVSSNLESSTSYLLPFKWTPFRG